MTKNDEYVVDIIDYGMDGEGIAKVNNITVFVQGALKNEKCKIHITKVLKNYAYAKVIEIIEQSHERAEIDCKTYPRCGGCLLRHISYDETLKIKKQKVQNLVNKMLKNVDKIEVEDTIGMETPRFYRNKAIYPISKSGKIGIYAKRSHEVIPFEECKIQTKISQEISKYIMQNWNDTIYDERTQKGLLRNIMIREGFTTNEVMVVLVQNGDSNIIQYVEDRDNRIAEKMRINAKQLTDNRKTTDTINKAEIKSINVDELLKRFSEIKTVVVNVNTENTNVILSNENIIIYGDGYITDKLCGFKFNISPNSFYQVNPAQTEKLYSMAIEKANLTKEDILCDLYCGIGTIGIIASKKVKKVYGIEIVKQAIEDAKENARINNIDNIEFINGDVETAFQKLLSENIKPSAVIVDPPRKGLDEKTIENIRRLQLDKLIYVSCNPATLMRDLQKLQETYNIKTIIPVDNFCYSTHVECITVMSLK